MYKLTEDIDGIKPSIDKTKMLLFYDHELDECLSYIKTTLRCSCNLYKSNLTFKLSYITKEENGSEECQNDL